MLDNIAETLCIGHHKASDSRFALSKVNFIFLLKKFIDFLHDLALRHIFFLLSSLSRKEGDVNHGLLAHFDVRLSRFLFIEDHRLFFSHLILQHCQKHIESYVSVNKLNAFNVLDIRLKQILIA
jgi:hypothetical protein